MTIQELNAQVKHNQIAHVRFIESGCSPFVIELIDKEKSKHLLTDKHGKTFSFKNISQAYLICREVGIHKAELVQVIPHDEACVGHYVSYEQQSIPLRF